MITLCAGKFPMENTQNYDNCDMGDTFLELSKCITGVAASLLTPCYGLNCAHPKFILKSQPLAPQIITLFGDKVF